MKAALAMPAVLLLGLVLTAAPPALAAERAPWIEAESISNITPGDATLEAWINPGGLETSYEFILFERLGCEKSSSPCPLIPIEKFTLPGAPLPASFESQHVSVDLNSAGVTLGASPYYFYEFTVFATNAAGGDVGTALAFNPAPIPPEDEPEVTEPPPEEKTEDTEPHLHDGSPGAPQGAEAGPPQLLPPLTGGAPQGPPKATPCRRAPRHHRAMRHRHHRAGIGKACHPA